MKELKVGERITLEVIESPTCEGCYCEEAQDGYAAENNIELED